MVVLLLSVLCRPPQNRVIHTPHPNEHPKLTRRDSQRKSSVPLAPGTNQQPMTIPTYPRIDGSLADFQLWEVIDRTGVLGKPPEHELRSAYRRQFSAILRVFPADRHGNQIGEAFAAIGKDISSSGIGFYHRNPIESKFAIIQNCDAESIALSTDGVLTRLVWCRFRQDGIYDSGGEFLRQVELRP